MQSKELTKKEAGMLAKFGAELYDDAEIEATDILIPKILLMQGLSKMVTDEKARLGEMRGSVDGTLLAARDKKLEVIFFKQFKTFVVMKKQGNEFVSQEPWVASEHAPLAREREGVLNGEEVKYFEVLNYYCLLPEEIKTGVYMPYAISFRSTGYQAGKKLESARAKLDKFKKPLAFRTFLLSAHKRENDLGTFFVWDVEDSRATTEEELEKVVEWKGIISSGNVNVDDSDFKESSDVFSSSTQEEGDEY